MLQKKWPILLFISLPFSTVFFIEPIFSQNFEQINEATGVNQTLNEGFGARASGMATTFGGFQNDADAVFNAPASMNDVDDFTFSTSHAEKFGEAKFDAFAFLFPFQSNTSLGVGLARYGVSGIELRPEGSSALLPQSPQLFSTADYLIVAAFSRRWNSLDVGTNFNLLYRQLDQDGIGIRADGMAQYTFQDQFRIGLLLKGLIPSSTAWQSGYSEYEPSDFYLTVSAQYPTPYFYGSLQIVGQTPGLFQKQAKSANETVGSRIYENPLDIFATSKLGFEYLFDFGLACRLGLSDLGVSQNVTSVATVGIGYAWRDVVGLDYSFTPHADLLSTHRISLHLTPSFPKFEGRNFRKKDPIPQRRINLNTNLEDPEDPTFEEEEEDAAPTQKFENASPPSVNTPASIDNSAPAIPTTSPSTPPVEQTPKVEKEVLDNSEE